jgi:hypothetical protein
VDHMEFHVFHMELSIVTGNNVTFCDISLHLSHICDRMSHSTWTPPGLHLEPDSTWNPWGRVKYTAFHPGHNTTANSISDSDESEENSELNSTQSSNPNHLIQTLNESQLSLDLKPIPVTVVSKSFYESILKLTDFSFLKWDEEPLADLDHDAPTSTVTPTATLLTTSSANSRKRLSDEHSDALSAKRRRQVTALAAISDAASSVRDLATAFTASGSSGDQSSPQRCTAAVKLIEDDGELSENEQLKFFQVLHKDVAVADFVLAIKDKGKRTRYIQSELDDL